MTTATKSKNVPLRALQFAADVAMDKAGGDGNVALTIKARSGKPVSHWWWGPVIHDLAGFKSKPSIPLDYCHDPREVVGFANKFDVGSGDLVVSGALTPFSADDRATEIVNKASRGVPYEASIFFDPYEMTVEEVPTGVAVNVNGADYVGPLSIVRQWTLRGVAVCPYGTDSQTAVEFGSDPSANREVAVSIFSKDSSMPNATLSGKPNGKTAFGDDAKDEEKPDDKKGEQAEDSEKECDCEGEEDCDCDKEKSEQSEESDDKPKDDDAGKQSAKAGPGAKFLTAFGDQGGVWFAQGKTFEEAQTLFNQQVLADREQLKKENAELKAKVKLARGEATPAKFSAPPTEADKAKAELTAKVGSPGIATFAASIKLPGQK